MAKDTWKYFVLALGIILYCSSQATGNAVYLQFLERTLPNNSYVRAGSIPHDPSGGDGLLCTSSNNQTTKQWYNPRGDPLGNAPGSGAYQNETARGVMLYREGNLDSLGLAGVYCCIIVDLSSLNIYVLYVGLYTGRDNSASGRANDGPDIVGDIQFELKTAPNVDPPVFQLTCTSSTAPATTVQWSKDGSPVSGGSSSQIVTDTVEATYINELTVTGRQSGTYTCTVNTWRAYDILVGESATASYTVVEDEYPPTPTYAPPPTPIPTDRPYDPYEPIDPYDPYPNYLCDLSQDEYGRPYYGPYDTYRPPYDPYPTDTYDPYPVFPTPVYNVNETENPPPQEPTSVSDKPLENAAYSEAQCHSFPACITSYECEQEPGRCSGIGVRYDSCGRRCTCRRGVLVDCCRVRKEWRSLTQAERCRYVRVVYIASTQAPWKSCYDKLIQIHRDWFGAGIHSQSYFLPWHRWFILALENLLRRIDCRVTVPYWDWSLESQTWQNSIVWSAQCGLGGNGDSFNSNQVTTGPFFWPSWQITPSATNQYLQRSFRGVLPSCATVAMIQRTGLSGFNTWHQFVSSSLHDTVHCSIGGTMCTCDAANAPEFFLHHGFIDKIWADWQNKGPAFKNHQYSQDNSEMPGAFGYSPVDLFDLNNQPGCVRVCLQPSSRPCTLGPSYTPLCPQQLLCSDYNLIKLVDLTPRPYPPLLDDGLDLFNVSTDGRLVASQLVNLFNSYDDMYQLLEDQGYGYGQNGPNNNPPNGDLQYDSYVYQRLCTSG